MTTSDIEKIKCFVVNIEARVDRRAHIVHEFEGRQEFAVTLVPAITAKNGAAGLLKTIQHIISDRVQAGDACIVLCEDDHQFTEAYSPAALQQSIIGAWEKEADLLCGGVSWFRNAVEATGSLFWVERFTGLQFTVIFRKFFSAILNISTENIEAVDLTLGLLTTRKFFIYPFISTQKEFGYSDVTSKNGREGHVTRLFELAGRQCEVLSAVRKFYPPYSFSKQEVTGSFAEISIPLYMIGETQLQDVEMQVTRQLTHRQELSRVVESGKNGWAGIVQCIKKAIGNGEDVVIIGKDSLGFTEAYNKDYLVSNILRAGELHCELLLGDMQHLYHAVPVAQHLFWIDSFTDARLIVVFSRCFEKIIREVPEPGKSICEVLSGITTHKMVLYPFITKKSAAAVSTEEVKALKDFRSAEEKLNVINDIFLNLHGLPC